MLTKSELAALDPSLTAQLQDCGFDPEWLIRMGSQLARGRPENDNASSNRVAHARAPGREELAELPTDPSERDRLGQLGRETLSRGELAFCVMAGGMATRMGGVVKALVEVVPGRTFLDLRLEENRYQSARAGVPIPLWLMTSAATDAPIREALLQAKAPSWVRTFCQGMGLRLTPTGELFRDDSGTPSSYATGHGDLVEALRRSGLLSSFIAQGGHSVWIANLDNLGATIDDAILGHFIESKASLYVEVCDKLAGDKGGMPVHAPVRDRERLQILEEFRLPKDFDSASVPVFNTNTFLIRAQELAAVDVPWTWFEVQKQVAGRTAVQFERLLQQLTAELETRYLRVPRAGEASRFLPVKDHAELARRLREITSVAEQRGMLRGLTQVA